MQIAGAVILSCNEWLQPRLRRRPSDVASQSCWCFSRSSCAVGGVGRRRGALIEGTASKSDIKFVQIFTARAQSCWIAAAAVTDQRKRRGRPQRVLQKFEYGVNRGRWAGMEAQV